jgi:hypothetical protein
MDTDKNFALDSPAIYGRVSMQQNNTPASKRICVWTRAKIFIIKPQSRAKARGYVKK